MSHLVGQLKMSSVVFSAVNIERVMLIGYDNVYLHTFILKIQVSCSESSTKLYRDV